MLHVKIYKQESNDKDLLLPMNSRNVKDMNPIVLSKPTHKLDDSSDPRNNTSDTSTRSRISSKGYLQGLRILVAIASYDFSQFPLLEEVLDSYQDVCVAGAILDLYIHTVLPYTGTYMRTLCLETGSTFGFYLLIGLSGPCHA
jgi:hypothetical protein